MGNKITLSPRRLLRVFEKQASYLIDNKYDQLTGVRRDQFLKELSAAGKELKSFSWLRFEEGHIPLLVVVSRRILDIELQMSKLKIGGNHGNCDMENFDYFKAPSAEKNIYLIFNVDSGRILGQAAASVAKVILKKNGRIGLLIEEGIALARYYYHVVQNKSLYLAGSMRDNPLLVPTMIYLPNSKCVVVTITKGKINQDAYVPSRDTRFDP